MENRPHWDINVVNSKQRVLNFILGERGVGKTFTTLEYCVKDALKDAVKDFFETGRKFIYMRRYESELKEAGNVLEVLSRDSEKLRGKVFTLKGNRFYCDDILVGYRVALSTSNHLKGSAFPDVNKLVFDEFLPESGVVRELPKEMHKFWNILETIFRMRDFKVYLLANTTSFNCCYRQELNLQLPFGDNEFWYSKEKSILVQLVHNLEYREAKMESCLGKLIKGTKYCEYAVNNKFYMDTNSFVKKRTGTFYELLSFAYQGKKYGLYVSRKEKGLIIDYSRKSFVDYQIRDFELSEEGVKTLSKSSHPVFRYMRNFFDVSHLFYQTQEIKATLHPFLYKIL